MRAVIQRVTKASVSVNGIEISSIGNGLCILVGLKTTDTRVDVDYIVNKILNLKIFEGADGKKRWSASVVDKQYEILCVSQFTLYHIMKGNKLDFHHSMPAALAEPLYNQFLQQLGEKYTPERIKDGKFGALMNVNIENNGPVTLTIDSPSSQSNNKK